MKLKHKIINQLIENKGREFSIREISKILKTDYKNTYDAISKIRESISVVKRSNASFIRFSPLLTNDVYETEKIRREKILENKSVKLVFDDLHKADNPFFAAVLFGSYAKGEQTKNSDIDICIIHDNEENYKKIHSILSIHPFVEIHEFSYKEFVLMLKDKSFNVGHEIVKDGIILSGIENYYKMIRHE